MGRYDNLYPAPGRILRTWGINVVNALNELYGFLTSGQQDIYVNEIYGRSGHFSDQLLVQGKPVIKDGDPISIYQLYDAAKSQITQAINDSLLTSYAKDSRDVLTKLVVDPYGRLGIKIAEPLDPYGRVRTSYSDELYNEFQPVSAFGSIVAANNTSGLIVTLYKGGRPNVNIYYNLGGAGNIYIEVSRDGSTWRPFDTITLSGAGSGLKSYGSIAYPYIRVRTDAVNIDVEFEIVASR